MQNKGVKFSMEDPSYYVKKIRRNDKGKIVKVKTSETLGGKPEKVLKRKNLVKHLEKGKNIRTSYLDDGRWTDGDRLELADGKRVRTAGNKDQEDNLGNLRSF